MSKTRKGRGLMKKKSQNSVKFREKAQFFSGNFPINKRKRKNITLKDHLYAQPVMFFKN
jgi:hypothetical protein